MPTIDRMTAVQSFHWTEDVNETLNYWFWLRSLGELEDGVLLDRVRHIFGLLLYVGYLELVEKTKFNKYLTT